MKLSYFVKLLALIGLFTSTLFASLQDKSAMIYYGNDISYPLVGVHDYIIVEPKNIETYTTGFQKYKNKIYAYVSINEMIKNSTESKQIKRSWIIGNNKDWKSYILNITDPQYQNYLLSHIQKLKDRGFKNFFFDTMDSYKLAQVSNEDKEQLRLGLIQFIKRFSKRFPKAKLITNRGFEIIGQIHKQIEAMLFESYYKGFSAKTNQYYNIPDTDRKWLDTQLKKVSDYNIPIIALDYLPINKQKEIKEDIKNLKNKGFIPCVSEHTLQYIGKSSKDLIKRDILILYNSHHLENDLITSSNAHLFASTPLEYMGFVPVLKDVNKPLPKHTINRYSGIIIWLENKDTDMSKLLKWARNQILEGSKVLFLGNNSLPLSSSLSSELGLKIYPNDADKNSDNKIVYLHKMMNYETKPVIKYHKYMIDLAKDQRPYLIYKNSKNEKSTLAAKTSWGGYVRDEALMSSFFGEYALWIIDPFKLFRDTLNLPTFPIPDPTTENGKRLSFVHIDGDGSANKVEHDTSIFSIELIEKDFVSKYHFPQSFSIVEAETAPYGKYPKYSPRLEAAAKKIYAKPYVEAATHTFTHPFFWRKIEKDPSNDKYRTNWNLKYKFTPKREILGSLDYINRRLLPKGKKRAKTIFWSGDCLPSPNIIRYCYKHHITNINGGDTIITNDKPWLQLIQPLGIKYKNYYQIYTGEQDENVYTNDWLGPYWGFQKVLQTFELTENPRRLKPVDVYFHYYSASKTASYKALKDVYEWVKKQDLFHIFTSQYPPKVTDFYDASIAKDKNSYLLCGFDNLRTVRIDSKMGLPDIQKSYGVLGYKRKNMDFYVHLDEKKQKYLTLSSDPNNKAYLIDANGRVTHHDKSLIHFKAYMPLKVDLYLKEGCFVKSRPKATINKRSKNILKLRYKRAKEADIEIRCN